MRDTGIQGEEKMWAGHTPPTLGTGPQKEKQIINELRLLEVRLEELGAAVERVERKCADIMTSAVPSIQKDEGKDSGGLCPLAMLLRTLRGKVEYSTRVLLHLAERIEL